MKEIIVIRQNEYMNSGLNVNVYINDQKAILPANSTMVINSAETEIFVKVKYLWLSSRKVMLNPEEQKFTVIIRPIFSNLAVLVVMLVLLSLFALTNFYHNQVFDLLFQIFFWSFVALFVFFITIGRSLYFKLEINPHPKIE